MCDNSFSDPLIKECLNYDITFKRECLNYDFSMKIIREYSNYDITFRECSKPDGFFSKELLQVRFLSLVLNHSTIRQSSSFQKQKCWNYYICRRRRLWTAPNKKTEENILKWEFKLCIWIILAYFWNLDFIQHHDTHPCISPQIRTKWDSFLAQKKSSPRAFCARCSFTLCQSALSKLALSQILESKTCHFPFVRSKRHSSKS